MGLRSDDIADTKYKIGDYVMFNLKNTIYNGPCNAMGVIHNVNSKERKYSLSGVECTYGTDNSFTVGEEDILDVFTKKDFETGGRYGKNIIIKKVLLFFRDKTSDYLPCMRNNFEDDIKEEMCKVNKYKFY